MDQKWTVFEKSGFESAFFFFQHFLFLLAAAEYNKEQHCPAA